MSDTVTGNSTPGDAGARLTSPDLRRGTRALRGSSLLEDFGVLGLLEAADAHVARTLLRLAGSPDDLVELAVAFAVRSARLGSVQVDLTTVAATAVADEASEADMAALSWPDPAEWVAHLERSPLVAVGESASPERPLRLLEHRFLALDRYWRHERSVAEDLLARAGLEPGPDPELGPGLDRLFPPSVPGAEAQRRAARTTLERDLSVIAGGPGTGKTTTVGRTLALLVERSGSHQWSHIALVAPTGKAAARLQDAVHREATSLDVDDRVRRVLLGLEASTIHRLLGRAPGSDSRFRHHAGNRLPQRIVVVDETSMVSVTLMARLLEAIRPDARVVLVGDPDQLTSVEAGAVLGDIVGPAGRDREASAPGPLAPNVTVLRHVHRFGDALAELADAVRDGDADRVLDQLRRGDPAVRWFDLDVATDLDGAGARAIDTIRHEVVASATTVMDAARRGDARTALDALGRSQILCAHRRGPYGVTRWRWTVDAWLAALVEDRTPGGWYPGRPVLVTVNDAALGLFNGDTGVTVAGPAGLACAFDRRGQVVTVNPDRIGAVETLHAITIHKSQGSQFGEVMVVLPGGDSPILTRELLYTALTRARDRVTVVGAAQAVQAAVARPVNRATGLGRRLWPGSGPERSPTGA